MASLRKVGMQWYCRHRDETGRQREVKCGPDKSVALSIKRDLESRKAKIKAGVLDPREADCLDAEESRSASTSKTTLHTWQLKAAFPSMQSAFRST